MKERDTIFFSYLQKMQLNLSKSWCHLKAFKCPTLIVFSVLLFEVIHSFGLKFTLSEWKFTLSEWKLHCFHLTSVIKSKTNNCSTFFPGWIAAIAWGLSSMMSVVTSPLYDKYGHTKVRTNASNSHILHGHSYIDKFTLKIK